MYGHQLQGQMGYMIINQGSQQARPHSTVKMLAFMVSSH